MHTLSRNLLIATAVVATGCVAGDDLPSIEASAGKADLAGATLSDVALTCEDPRDAQDPRSRRQLWLTEADGGFVLEHVANVYNPYEDYFTVERTELGRFPSCAAAAADPRFVACLDTPAFFNTALVEKTALPFGGSTLSSTSTLELTYQTASPGDRQILSFPNLDSCWPSSDGRLQD